MSNNNARKAFSDIYDKWVDKIYRFVFLKVGTQEVAQDLTSEVFTKAWHSFRTRAEKGSRAEEIKNISAFLYQIARNLIADYYRERGRAQVVSVQEAQLAGAELSGENIEAQMAVSSDMERVRLAMAELKDEYREILIWYYLDELKVPEIAKLTDKSEEAVRVTIHRALNALRERLGS